MKRFSILITCVFLCFAYSAASAWAIWEGNAGIAAASEFPGKGMYAKSDMFPKNTVVLIENLETGIKVRAVVTGPSGISGLVAVLSPETAAALNIRSGSVSRVRISIPSVVSEKSATGVAGTETAPASADPDVNPAAATAVAAPIPLESIANAQENPLVPLDTANAAVTPEAGVTATPNAPAAPEKSATTESLAEQPVPVDAVAESAEPAESVAPAAVAAPVAIASAPDAAESGSAEAEPIAEESGEVPAKAETAAVAEPDALAPAAESQAAASPAFYDEPELAATEMPAKGEEALPIESDSVALVPTEPNPPARSEGLDAAAVSAVSAPVAAPVLAAALTAPASAAPVASTSDATANAALAALPCVSSLAKGSYYVQIASYSDPIRAKKVVDGYAPKYPIVVEQGTTARGSVLKVCVGPVKKDEYGAILERFKSLGFKDAFVRKGE